MGSKNTDQQRVVVFAAASLREAFDELAAGFEEKNPDIDIQMAVAGSQILKMQIKNGAQADVFASADPSHLIELVNSGKIDKQHTFAYNHLTVIAPNANPANIDRFQAISNAKKIVIGTPSVPIGQYTRRVLDKAAEEWGAEFRSSFLANVVSEEMNVRLVRAKVELGEADAAIVYKTDALASKKISQIAIPPEFNVRTELAIATLTTANSKEEANRFIEFVMSHAGQTTLKSKGFDTVTK